MLKYIEVNAAKKPKYTFDKAKDSDDDSSYDGDKELPKRRVADDDLDLELDIPSFLRNRDDY